MLADRRPRPPARRSTSLPNELTLRATADGLRVFYAPVKELEHLRGAVLAAGTTSLVEDRVDWAAFLGRHDLLWETLPAQFDHGAFLGNGLLGAMLYRDGPKRLRWEMGRADVTEHRREPPLQLAVDG